MGSTKVILVRSMKVILRRVFGKGMVHFSGLLETSTVGHVCVHLVNMVGNNDKMEGKGVFVTREGRSYDVECLNN